jgi:hypothetical protein
MTSVLVISYRHPWNSPMDQGQEFRQKISLAYHWCWIEWHHWHLFISIGWRDPKIGSHWQVDSSPTDQDQESKQIANLFSLIRRFDSDLDLSYLIIHYHWKWWSLIKEWNLAIHITYYTSPWPEKMVKKFQPVAEILRF